MKSKYFSAELSILYDAFTDLHLLIYGSRSPNLNIPSPNPEIVGATFQDDAEINIISTDSNSQ